MTAIAFKISCSSLSLTPQFGEFKALLILSSNWYELDSMATRVLDLPGLAVEAAPGTKWVWPNGGLEQGESTVAPPTPPVDVLVCWEPSSTYNDVMVIYF